MSEAYKFYLFYHKKVYIKDDYKILSVVAWTIDTHLKRPEQISKSSLDTKVTSFFVIVPRCRYPWQHGMAQWHVLQTLPAVSLPQAFNLRHVALKPTSFVYQLHFPLFSILNRLLLLYVLISLPLISSIHQTITLGKKKINSTHV